MKSVIFIESTNGCFISEEYISFLYNFAIICLLMVSFFKYFNFVFNIAACIASNLEFLPVIYAILFLSQPYSLSCFTFKKAFYYLCTQTHRHLLLLSFCWIKTKCT